MNMTALEPASLLSATTGGEELPSMPFNTEKMKICAPVAPGTTIAKKRSDSDGMGKDGYAVGTKVRFGIPRHTAMASENDNAMSLAPLVAKCPLAGLACSAGMVKLCPDGPFRSE